MMEEKGDTKDTLPIDDKLTYVTILSSMGEESLIETKNV